MPLTRLPCTFLILVEMMYLSGKTSWAVVDLGKLHSHTHLLQEAPLGPSRPSGFCSDPEDLKT